MVYESDFYTTRRPYSRPTVTSYSVTRREVPWEKVPTVPRPSQVPPCFTVFGSKTIPGQTFHRNIPHIAHKRLVNIGPSTHGVRVKQSMVLAEIDRITHKVRPSLAYQPVEDFLNSRSLVSFDDETRSIRAKTAELLKRIHTPVPRAQRPLPLPGDSIYSHSELPITDRITSDNYINRLLESNKEVHNNVLNMSHYNDPGAKTYQSIGKGHLACVSFAGGRPISKRRNLAAVDDQIRDDIKFLSHYGRFRAAANEVTPHLENSDYVSQPGRRAPTKSFVTGSWKSNAPPKSERQTANTPKLTAGEEYDAALDRKKKRRENIEAIALMEAEEEKKELARRSELARQEELALVAAQERQEELERRAAQALKEEAERREEAEKLEAERRAEEEKRAKEEAERKAEEARLAEEEARRLEEEKIAQEEEERKAREEDERQAKEEAERLAKEEEERRAREEQERVEREETERKAEEDRKAQEEAERLAKEEEERKAREEAERIEREEAEQKEREEAEQRAREEAEQKAREEEEQRAKEQAEAEQHAEEVAVNEEVNQAEEGAENEAEPLVEEPQSPETQNEENEEVQASTTEVEEAE